MSSEMNVDGEIDGEANKLSDNNRAAYLRSIFEYIVYHPWLFIMAGMLLLIIGVGLATQLQKDTRSDAFLAADNPALLYRQQVKELFGLSDPLVVALVTKHHDSIEHREQTAASIFQSEPLKLVAQMTEILRNIENIDPDRVTSLATENNIVGTLDGMDVQPFYQDDTISDEVAQSVQEAIREFPLYQGSLVANDESATLIIAELMDESLAEQSYETVLAAMNAIELPENMAIHVAGEGAISGYLGSYIDADAQRLNPIAGVVISIIVFIAFLRISPVVSSLVIIGASVLISIGIMAFSGVPFYVITNALPVILIGISVADTIHIYSEYFDRRVAYPDETLPTSIVESLLNMWRPVTLTTLTTAAGFFGLYLAAYMPPFKYFGLFAALGVVLAWLYAMFFLPAVMSVFRTDIHPLLAKKRVLKQQELFASVMVALGRLTHHFSKTIIVISVLMIGFGLMSARHLTVNDDRIETFSPQEPLYIADQIINERFDGTSYLDVVIETPETEGLFAPDVLLKIEALQAYAESLEGIQGSVSIVDYLKQMNRALNEGSPQAYRLPQDRELVAQYLLLYSASSEPTDFEEEIDYDYRIANVRLVLNDAAYHTTKQVVKTLENYLVEQFNRYDEQGEAQLTAALSGRVNLNYHWLKDLGESHFVGVGIALSLVFLVSAFLFGSLVAGFYALLPIIVSILIIYTSMVLLNIPLGIGTSMFAAVAIGLGVDFAIHTIDRIRSLYRHTQDIDKSLQQFYPSTGRALFFNLLAIALGFGVLISSQVLPLNAFGSIVAIAVTTSFIMSMTLLPALIKEFKPHFILK